MIDDLEADLVCCNKDRQSLQHRSHQNGFRQMFNQEETDLRAVAVDNIHKNVGKYQEGGTAMLVYGHLIDQYDMEESGKDDLGLGRWTFMQF